MGVFQAQFFDGNNQCVTVDHVAPGGGRASGEVVPLATNCLIVHTAIEPNKLGAGSVAGGTYIVHKESADVFADGAKVWWDNTNNRGETTDGGGTNKFMGYAVGAFGNGTTTMKVNHARA